MKLCSIQVQRLFQWMAEKNKQLRFIYLCQSNLLFISFYVACLEYIQLHRRKQFMEKIAGSKAGQYKFGQIFGYKGPNQKIMEEDIITSLRFDHSGNYLAVGDKAGRVIVFEAQNAKKGQPNYEYFTEFQSHIKEFDPLRSMEIDEQIVAMQWMKPQGRYLKMATTNSRSIKLWKMFERSDKKVVKSAGKELVMPKLQILDTNFVAEVQAPFPSKHVGSINSLSVSSNEEYMISSDDSQVFLWSVEKPLQPFILANFLTKQEDENKEVVTCSQFHPTSDSLFVYGMSKGTLKIGDMRNSSVGQGSVCLGQSTTPPKNYIYELLSSYSDAKFIKSGKYVVSRDCLTVKLWDICSPKKPVKTMMLNDGLKSKLCEMVQNQAIFDKFSINGSHDGATLLTGSYNNCFHLMDLEEGSNLQYQLNYKKNTLMKSIGKGNSLGDMDYTYRTIAGDFNPTKNLLAVASKNCFFTYSM